MKNKKQKGWKSISVKAVCKKGESIEQALIRARKKLSRFWLVLIFSFALTAHASVQVIDQTTLHTNTTSSSGYIWAASAGITNAAYTVVSSNAVSRGDSTSNAWAKANANFNYLDTNQQASAAWGLTNYAIQTKQVVCLFTNLYPAATNDLGTVSGFFNYSLTQYTNLDPLLIWYDTATMTGTNYNPAHTFDFGTNGYWAITNALPTNAVWVALACSNVTAQAGQPATLTINSSLVYSNYTLSPTVIGLYIGTTNNNLTQTTNFSPASLYGSGDGTNYGPIANYYPTTNTLWIRLVAATNSPAPGAFTSLTVYNLTNPGQYQSEVQFHSRQITGASFYDETISKSLADVKAEADTNQSNITYLMTNIPSWFRAGSVVVASLGTSTNITFSTPFDSRIGTNYSVAFGVSTAFASYPNPEYQNKTTNGFTLNVSSVMGGGSVNWIALPKQ